MKLKNKLSLVFIVITLAVCSDLKSQEFLNQSKAYILQFYTHCKVVENTANSISFECDKDLTIFNFDSLGLCDFLIHSEHTNDPTLYDKKIADFLAKKWEEGNIDTFLCKSNNFPMPLKWFHAPDGKSAAISNYDIARCYIGYVSVMFYRD